jgi:hypothetical protein
MITSPRHIKMVDRDGDCGESSAITRGNRRENYAAECNAASADITGFSVLMTCVSPRPRNIAGTH